MMKVYVMEAWAQQESHNRSENDQESNSTDENQIWRMRWYFFWIGISLCVLWMIVAIVISFTIFSMTRNYFSFIFSGSVGLSIEFMRRFAEYLLPMDEKRFQLKKMRIEMKMRNKQRSTDKTFT